MKDKIHHKPVLTALQNIIEQTKKKADAKAVCIELEEKIQELLEAEANSDSRLMPPPSIAPKTRKNIRQSKRKDDSSDDSSDDSEEDADSATRKCKIKLVFYII